jgi:paraquat-inducible protein B
MTDDSIPSAVAGKPKLRWLQPVWVVPIVAGIIGAWLLLQGFIDRGPTITIHFRSAEWIEANKTKIKYKEVDIGTVKSIRIADDRKTVLVTAEMSRHAPRALLVEDTRFWVVRPRISGGHVSGLSTLLAGAYIGTDPGKSATERRDFEGLETPPAVTSDLPGRQFTLSADDLGSIDIGTPVYYRGLSVGQVVSTELAKDGKQVRVGLFVQAPYDQFVTSSARFWNASGIDLALDATGLKLDTQSLVTVLVGGIAFEPAEDASAAAVAAADRGATFNLWRNRADAMKPRETVVETYALVFEQSVRGLQAGAPVDFRGVALGEVTKIELDYDPAHVKVRTVVEIRFYPERLNMRARAQGRKPQSDVDSKQRMQRFVNAGFRAQLRAANLITGQQYVALDFFPNVPPAIVDFGKSPPEIPTVAASLAEIQESLAAIVKKLEKVPFDVIGEDLRKALAGLRATLANVDNLAVKLDKQVAPELQKTLEQARRTLESAEKAIASDSPLQGDLRDTLQEVSRASEAVRALMDYLERQPDALIRGRREGKNP